MTHKTNIDEKFMLSVHRIELILIVCIISLYVLTVHCTELFIKN